MIITVLMAGEDTAARSVYDGLFRYCRFHHSTRSPYLMAWAQNPSFRDVDGGTATDGDLDIAYSLLLAAAQWGGKGTIDYHREALAMLTDILSQEINPLTHSILIGNSVQQDSKDYYDMRSSDFMPSHFKAFAAATHNDQWNKVTSANYNLFHLLQQRYSPDAGLVPDFIQHINKRPSPARSRYLESKYDGSYNYNACRVPWRIAADYILNSDSRAKTFVQKINRWLRTTTSNNPDNISAGYSLAGDDLKTRNFEALSFITSFAVAATVDKTNQQWLNDLWNYTMHFKLNEFDYYDNSIKMITIIMLSGNYWQPPN